MSNRVARSRGSRPAESLAVVLTAAMVIACGGPMSPEREQEIEEPAQTASAPASTVDPPSPSPGTSPVAPATAAEVRGKVTAIFGGSVREPGGRASRFLTGDFNGDGWQDLAVVVRPATGSLADINSPVASWIVKDVEPPPDPTAQVRPSPVRVEAADALLAVIHGYGEKGWRDPQARQTYLLRNATGETMDARPLEGLIPVPPGKKFTGDVITQTRAGQRSFLFWTGATYRRHVLSEPSGGSSPAGVPSR